VVSAFDGYGTRAKKDGEIGEKEGRKRREERERERLIRL